MPSHTVFFWAVLGFWHCQNLATLGQRHFETRPYLNTLKLENQVLKWYWSQNSHVWSKFMLISKIHPYLRDMNIGPTWETNIFQERTLSTNHVIFFILLNDFILPLMFGTRSGSFRNQNCCHHLTRMFWLIFMSWNLLLICMEIFWYKNNFRIVVQI